MVYLDTHAALWLVAGSMHLLSRSAKEHIDKHDLLISPMVYLEFEYLRQKGDLKRTADGLFADLNTMFGVALCTYPFAAVCREATKIAWTRDPFDRIIVGYAQAQNAKLITADRKIRLHYPEAVW